MSKKALITFTPLEPYFFGGETTHGNGRERNYFSKSNLYPQQTTLCGALRFLLLQHGYNHGLNSFTPEDATLNDYGDLLHVSPLFLKNPDGHFFLRQALDRQPEDSQPLCLETAVPHAWALLDNGAMEYPTQWVQGSRWPTYEPKRKRANEWVSPSAEPVRSESIFMVFNRPGIPKEELRNPNPRADGPGLFKQDLFRLAENWAFSILVEFSDKVNLTDLNNQNIPMGGEKSVFHLSVVEENRSFADLFPAKETFYRVAPDGGQPRLVLASDAWVTNNVWENTLGAVTETTDFRHIHTHISVNKFGPMQSPFTTFDAQNPRLRKSTKYTLLARGSVLVCADRTALHKVESALAILPWQGIGFNHFISFYP